MSEKRKMPKTVSIGRGVQFVLFLVLKGKSQIFRIFFRSRNRGCVYTPVLVLPIPVLLLPYSLLCRPSFNHFFFFAFGPQWSLWGGFCWEAILEFPGFYAL